MSDKLDHIPTPRRFGHRLSGAVAVLAMGSWVVLAAIPMVVALIALT